MPEGRHNALWIVDPPMFEWSDTDGRWTALHHPFTAPLGSFEDPGAMSSRGYDMVLGISEEEAQSRFGFLLDALRYGAPPHGGLALGIDRIAAILAGRESIRDVMAFPKTASGSDPLTGAPAAVSAGQLGELGLKVTAPPRTA